MNTIDSAPLLKKMQEMISVIDHAGNKTNGVENDIKGFSSIFSDAINSVNNAQKTSSELKKGLELGDPDISLTQVMIASQKAEISFQALLQVRNKLLMAYQEVMRMQI